MMKTKRKAVSSTISALAIIIALAVGGAGGYFYGQSISGTTKTVTSTVTSTATGTATALQSQAQLAQAECGTQSTCLVVLSTVDASDFNTEMAPLFFQQYPWAQGKLNWQGLTASQVTTELISQFQAGKVQSDLSVVTEGIVYPAINAGAIDTYVSPQIAALGYPSGAYDPTGLWTTTFLSVPVLQYNPNVLKQLSLPTPTQWSDLGNPVYKGHIGFQTAASLSATTGIFYYLSTQMSNSTWTALMQSIAANNPTITPSASTTTNNVVTGNIAVGIGLYNDYLSAHATANASQISFVAPSPNVFNPGVVAMSKNAPHPQMAKLMEDWLISAAGQTGFALTARSPFQSTISGPLGLIPPGVTLVNSYTNPAIFQNTGKWSDLFKSIFGK
jgi:ABC-type Fe3+ transport system substrate-binding protein